MKTRMALALLLTLAIVLAGCSRPTTTPLPAAVDQHLTWIPKTVNALAYFDAQSMRQSELGKALEKDWGDKITRLREEKDYQELLERTGFDFEKDFHSVLVGLQGSEQESMNNFALVVTGNFDEQKIINTVNALRDSIKKHHDGHDVPELSTEIYAGKTIYVIKNHGDKTFYFADAHTLIAGNNDWVKAVIDGKTAGESVKDNAPITALMEKLRYKDQCWMVANTAEVMTAMAEELGEHGDFKGTRALKSLQGVTFSANVGAKARLYGEVLCDNEENSKLMAEAVKGALATAKLAVSDDREAVDMLNRIDIDLKGKSVKFSADLDKAFFDKMREKAERHRKTIALR
ncbi:MAG: hypothetical protein ONB44_07095 [candidate division KSB1 bacterium]|nr:hypothetical protein [candidate division KSB1 bacterium]MDZ7301891.1 hypothetical protein [candidate division KSB1 bacterium]MDZ7310274.1 hypothetical protein [candidate division KSB1 bacterium]